MASYTHSFSFAGAGWMMVYEFGVARVLQQYNLPYESRFIGTSAGALAATGLAIDADFDAVVETIICDHVPLAYASLHGPFQLREYLKQGFSKHGNLHKYTQLNAEPGRVTIVYTSITSMTSRRKSCGFQSAEHLMQTLLASCCAPPLAGWPFRLDGELILDGGVLDNQPMFADDPEGKRTVTVSPNYYSGATIKPSQYFPPWWTAFPSSQDDTRWVYALGRADALRWLVAQGLAPSSELAKVNQVKPLQWKTPIGARLGYRALDAELVQVMKTLLVVASGVALALVSLLYLHANRVVRLLSSPTYALGLSTSIAVALLWVL